MKKNRFALYGTKKSRNGIYEAEDEVLFERALNLLSHGKYSIYEPVDMSEDNKELFKRILNAFLEKHKFELPELLKDSKAQKV